MGRYYYIERVKGDRFFEKIKARKFGLWQYRFWARGSFAGLSPATLRFGGGLNLALSFPFLVRRRVSSGFANIKMGFDAVVLSFSSVVFKKEYIKHVVTWLTS